MNGKQTYAYSASFVSFSFCLSVQEAKDHAGGCHSVYLY